MLAVLKDEPRPKYEVNNETAVPWKQPEWADFYNELKQSLVSGLNMNEREVTAVSRLLVSLSAWREEGLWLGLSMSQLEDDERCNGVEEWRGDVLYIRHGVGCVCPMHGQSHNGRRKLVYVGKKEHKQARAKNAITRQEIYDGLLKKSAHLATMADELSGVLIQVAKRNEVM